MLKNEDLVRAVKVFENRPVYVKLINQLWMQVKDFDFEHEKELTIERPKRVYHNSFYFAETKPGREEYFLQIIKLTQNYSHRAIRKVLRQWKLGASIWKFADGERIIIHRLRKKQRKKGTRKNHN